MCGIIAAIAERNVVPILIEGLKKLEYRGYDSAGLAVIKNNKFLLHRSQGKVKNLQELVTSNASIGNIGIAHTRWATHGKPCEMNAHPHIIKDKIAVVHNGIIENYQELKTDLMLKHQVEFFSETDSEVIAAKTYVYLMQGMSFFKAVAKTCKELVGAYAICVIDVNNPDEIIAARFGSPLIIGIGIGEYFIASDSLALQNLTQNLIYLQDGDLIKISRFGFNIFDFGGKQVKRTPVILKVLRDNVEKGDYRHFMQKEIFEQPQAILNTIDGRIVKNRVIEEFLGINAKKSLEICKNIQIVACGTSYYAGLVAKYWFEEFIGIPCRIEVASEFRYMHRIILEDTLLITISQSGETADTIAAVKSILDLPENDKNKYCGILTVCNVPESALVRSAELVALTNAGPEIGVASTKAFTTQLTMLLMLTIILMQKSLAKPTRLQSKLIVKELLNLPDILKRFLKLSQQIQIIAKIFEHKKSALFLGRGVLYPLALEGALKLKELSYIHAEAYPAGELKHGPLALVDDEMPVVVVMAKDHLEAKLKSNIEEIQARGGNLIVFADQAIKWKSKKNMCVIELPTIPAWLTPIAYAIPLQLLAYYVALLKGTDVDQPRNLAKSVTVE